MKISIAQLNPIIGDFKGNLYKIEQTLSDVQKENSDLTIFPELFLTGYPPRDLLERKDFVEKTQETHQQLIKISKNFPRTAVLCGTIQPTEKSTGNGLYNTAMLVHNGRILFRHHKTLLPTYDVFDETRYFDPAEKIDTFDFQGQRLGISICEDAWNDPELGIKRIYSVDPLEILAKKGATLFINISASPFHIGKENIRYRLIGNRAMKYQRPFFLVNQIGANDELIFDGRSLVFDSQGSLITLFPSFKEYVQTIDLDQPHERVLFEPQEEISSIHDALILGISDYMRKCNFNKVVLGLSGGIDSALVSCLACRAIGVKNVIGIAMPSPYTAKESIEDAEQLSKNLGISFKIIPITPVYHSYLKTLKYFFKGKPADITEENIQARIRGNILMALSNKFGCLPLSTGNKSELSVGYCTLYGDMSGGLSVIADVPKTMVYRLAELINQNEEIIPRRILEKPPTAELRPSQKDQDTLPPYEILDNILALYLDQGCSKEEIVQNGFIPETVDWVIHSIKKNEFKRRQASPGLKVTSKAFGMGRRMPIAARI